MSRVVCETWEGWWPIQAWLWLEWGSSTAGQSLPAARSRFRAVHSDSISTRPSVLGAPCLAFFARRADQRQSCVSCEWLSFPPVVILSGAKDLCIFVRMNAWRVSIPRVLCETWAGGPFKPGFGLSGAVLPLDKVFQPRARVFAPSIPTRSLRVL
jgi:hypothetical protein